MLFLFLVLVSSSLFSQTIKLSSVAPESTPWGQGLNQMAAEWSKISNGRVRLRIFHGGIAGTESDSVRKMRLGQIQGVSVSPVGLGAMVPELWGMVIPGVIKSREELSFVLADIEDELAGTFRENGYEVLTWSNAGWIRFFSTEAIRSPEDLRGLRIAATSFHEDFNIVLRNLGMQTVSTSASEILTSLNSGLVDSLIYVPLGVAGFQWFAIADKMSNVDIAPLYGAIVMDSRAWNRIPDQYHEEFREVAERIGKDIEIELDVLEKEAIDIMVEYGLEVIESTEAEKATWVDVLEEARVDLQETFFFSRDHAGFACLA